MRDNLAVTRTFTPPANGPLLALEDDVFYKRMFQGPFVVTVVSSSLAASPNEPHAAFFINQVPRREGSKPRYIHMTVTL